MSRLDSFFLYSYGRMFIFDNNGK